MTQAAVLAQMGNQNQTFRNRLINGDFRIWQRGTSGFTTLNVYSADRWIVSGTTNTAVGQSTDVPAGFKYSLSMTGSGYPQTYQRIESLNCTDLVGQSVTISFWAKQTTGAGASSLGVNLYSANAADNFSAVTQIGSTGFFAGTTGWVQYSYTINSLPAAAANGLQCLIYANTGSTATFLVTGVQLEVGTVATDFEFRPYGTELALCQRYYFYYNTYSIFIGQRWTTNLVWAGIPTPVVMRTTPSVASTGAGALINRADGGQSATTSTINTVSTQSAGMPMAIVVFSVSYDPSSNWTFSIYASGLTLSAEL